MSKHTRKEAADKVGQWLTEEKVGYQRDFNDPGVIHLDDFFGNHTKNQPNIHHAVRLSCDLSNIPYMHSTLENAMGIDGVEVQVVIQLTESLKSAGNEKLVDFVMRVCNLTNPFFKYVRTSQGGIMVMQDMFADKTGFQHMMYKLASYVDTARFIKSEKFGRFLDECIANGYQITDELLKEHFDIHVEKIHDSRDLN